MSELAPHPPFDLPVILDGVTYRFQRNDTFAWMHRFKEVPNANEPVIKDPARREYGWSLAWLCYMFTRRINIREVIDELKPERTYSIHALIRALDEFYTYRGMDDMHWHPDEFPVTIDGEYMIMRREVLILFTTQILAGMADLSKHEHYPHPHESKQA